MRWRLLSTPPLDGAANMAVDVSLMGRARNTGEAVLRTYQWSRPTLSLGRNQPAATGYRRVQIESRGFDVVRRPTGGRAILHWRELTYSVTAPLGGLSALADEYARINGILVAAFRRLGIEAEVMAVAGEPHRPGLHPCFAEPAAGEIVVRNAAGASKLVGSAQYREAGALLQHGSILLHDDQPLLRELTREAVAGTQAASMSALLGREVTPREVERVLFETVRDELDPDASALEFPGVSADARREEAMFRDPLWTWRR